MIYIIKIFQFLFSLILFMFASLQFNDPDLLIWVSVYAICALVPALLLVNRFYPPIFWLAIILCGVEVIGSAPGAYEYILHMAQEPLMQKMNTEKLYIEECREFLGALIALALVVLSALLARVKVLRF